MAEPGSTEEEYFKNVNEGLAEWSEDLEALKPHYLESLDLKQVQTYDPVKRKAVEDTAQVIADKLNIDVSDIGDYVGAPGTYQRLDVVSKEDWDAFHAAEDDFNSDYEFVKLTSEEIDAGLTPQERIDKEIAYKTSENVLLALDGKLPVSESFKQQKASQWETFKESQARQGNIITGATPEEGVSQSSPGIQALRQFRERFNILEESIRRGEIQSGTSNLLAMQQGRLMKKGFETSSFLTFPGRGAGFIQSSLQAHQPFQFRAGLASQERVGESQATAQATSDLFGTAGDIYATLQQ